MKKILQYSPYVLIPLLGMLWAIGCSTSPSGGSGPISYYRIDLSVEPPAIDSGNGLGAIVYCYLYYGNDRVSDGTILFHAASGNLSNMTSSADVSDTSQTGTLQLVHYFPNYVSPGKDTVYATFYSDVDSIILAADTSVVTILPP